MFWFWFIEFCCWIGFVFIGVVTKGCWGWFYYVNFWCYCVRFGFKLVNVEIIFYFCITVVSKHIDKIILKLWPIVSGHPALIKNAKRVSYFLLSKPNKFDRIFFDFLFIPSIFCKIIFLHLYLVIKGAKHGYSLSMVDNADVKIFKWKASAF